MAGAKTQTKSKKKAASSQAQFDPTGPQNMQLPQPIQPPLSAKSKRPDVPPVPQDTMTRTISGQTMTRSAHNVVLSRAQAEEVRKERRRARLLLIIAAGLFLMSGSILAYQFTRLRQPSAEESAKYQLQLANRIEHHKNQTGFKVNIQRNKVEADNFLYAPPVANEPASLPITDVMAGLTLTPELHHRESSRDRGIPLNPTYADANIQYQLKIQQENQEMNDLAKEKFVRDFVRNAKSAGYDVVVKENMDVVIKHRPSGRKTSSSSTLQNAASAAADESGVGYGR